MADTPPATSTSDVALKADFAGLLKRIETLEATVANLKKTGPNIAPAVKANVSSDPVQAASVRAGIQGLADQYATCAEKARNGDHVAAEDLVGLDQRAGRFFNGSLRSYDQLFDDYGPVTQIVKPMLPAYRDRIVLICEARQKRLADVGHIVGADIGDKEHVEPVSSGRGFRGNEFAPTMDTVK